MADQKGGGITWTDETWNPVRGCSRVSEGCRHCYAERVAARFSGPGLPYEGLAEDGKWTGKVRLIPEHLADPLRWTKPRRIFVNSMSDLFHEGLSDEDIARIFIVMQKAKQHTFQILTKRPQRMLDWCRQIIRRRGDPEWFLPNVWLGVSVEDQKTADERIPLLLQTPAAVRFVSYEPALGPVNFRTIASLPNPPFGLRSTNALAEGSGLHWIIVGGESGTGARPCDLKWIRDVVEDCARSTVRCFVKQLGKWIAGDHAGFTTQSWLFRDGRRWIPPIIGPAAHSRPLDAIAFSTTDSKGGDMAEWPEDLRVREFPISC